MFNDKKIASLVFKGHMLSFPDMHASVLVIKIEWLINYLK